MDIIFLAIAIVIIKRSNVFGFKNAKWSKMFSGLEMLSIRFGLRPYMTERKTTLMSKTNSVDQQRHLIRELIDTGELEIFLKPSERSISNLSNRAKSSS